MTGTNSRQRLDKEQKMGKSLFEDLISGRSSSTATRPEVVAERVDSDNSVIQKIQNLPLSERQKALSDFIKSEVKAVLGLPDSTEVDEVTSVVKMGMDSLISIQFRNRLKKKFGERGRDVPATFVFTYPTVEKMVAFIFEKFSFDKNGSQPPIDVKKIPIQSPQKSVTATPMMAESSAKEHFSPIEAEPIAIVGMSCRFPGGSNDLPSFWNLLAEGREAVDPIPGDRWDHSSYVKNSIDSSAVYARTGAFISGIGAEEFDADFFGLNAIEASSMDPQQRLLLEVTWESFENAGISPESLRGTNAGVFIGIMWLDYYDLLKTTNASEYLSAHVSVGNVLSGAAGRISYTFGFNGPSLAVDAACSSSLLCLHHACKELRSGSCNVAVAGGVNLMLSPDKFAAMCKLQALSKTGHNRTFDAAADGYVRSEGCGIVVLKRLSDAQRDGDRILSLVLGTAYNHDGGGASFTAPNGASQEAVIRNALRDARVHPADISYVEAHGTGTPIGDPIELSAIANVMKEGRSAANKLNIGSVKANLGHAESAAGIIGVIKTVLALGKGLIPPQINFSQLNPDIDLDQIPATINTELKVWPPINGRRTAGVSSFGLTGINAHVVLQDYPKAAGASGDVAQTDDEGRPYLLVLSAKSSPALNDLANRYHGLLKSGDHRLIDVCFTAGAGRSHFSNRLAVSGNDVATIQHNLEKFMKGESEEGVCSGRVVSKNSLKIAFLFSGQGEQRFGMGKELYHLEPIFRKYFDQCRSFVLTNYKIDLLEIIFNSSDVDLINQTRYTQPCLFAVEYSLAQMWIDLGVVPSALLGHSVGEIAAACVAGVIELDGALRLVCTRAQLMGNLSANGEMASINLSEEQTRTLLKGFEEHVSIAAVNSPGSIVLAGEANFLSQVLLKVETFGGKVKKLRVSHAFHSPQVEPMLEEFQKFANTIEYSIPLYPLVSNVTGTYYSKETPVDGKYWRDHVRQEVKFAQGSSLLISSGIETFLEIGPGTALLGLTRLQRSGDRKINCLPSMKKGRAEAGQVCDTLGALYVQGVAVSWMSYFQGKRTSRVETPSYPFQRKSYWIGEKKIVRSPARSDGESRDQKISIAAQTQRLTAAERLIYVTTLLRAELTRILGLTSTDQVDVKLSFEQIGVDSLLAIELRDRLQIIFGEVLSSPLARGIVFESTNLENLAESIVLQMKSGRDEKSVVISTRFGANRWFTDSNRNPSTRLFCFPYSGGSSQTFSGWEHQLPKAASVCMVQLPGRWTRIDEAPVPNMTDLANEIVSAIGDRSQSPFSFLGYSMGAVLAFEVARQLKEKGLPQPHHLYAISAPAPHLPRTSSLHKLPRAEFLARLHELFNGLGSLFEADIDSQDVFIRLLRADIEALETYSVVPGDQFDFPVSVFGGKFDPSTSVENMSKWRELTRSQFESHFFNSGHFLDQQAVEDILKAISYDMDGIIRNTTAIGN